MCNLCNNNDDSHFQLGWSWFQVRYRVLVMVFLQKSLLCLVSLDLIWDEKFWNLVDCQASVLLEFCWLLDDLPDQDRLRVHRKSSVRIAEPSILHDASLVIQCLVFRFVRDTNVLTRSVLHVQNSFLVHTGEGTVLIQKARVRWRCW